MVRGGQGRGGGVHGTRPYAAFPPQEDSRQPRACCPGPVLRADPIGSTPCCLLFPALQHLRAGRVSEQAGPWAITRSKPSPSARDKGRQLRTPGSQSPPGISPVATTQSSWRGGSTTDLPDSCGSQPWDAQSHCPRGELPLRASRAGSHHTGLNPTLLSVSKTDARVSCSPNEGVAAPTHGTRRSSPRARLGPCLPQEGLGTWHSAATGHSATECHGVPGPPCSRLSFQNPRGRASKGYRACATVSA